MRKITYITYQGIPSLSTIAHGIHTFSNIKYFVKNDYEVDLIFPLREKNSTTDLSQLKNFYEIDEDFEIKATKHYLPFGRVRFLEKYMYIFSHIIWSFYVSNKISREKDLQIFTLSDWVFYFLSKKGINVVFECHDLTKLRIKIVNKAMKSKNSKLICINKFIKEDLKLDSEKNVIVLENGFDSDLFKSDNEKCKKTKIIFSGNLKRFGKNRGIEEIIKYFINSEFNLIAELHIYGGPDSYASKIKEKYINQNVFVHGHIKRKKLSKVLSSSHLGILCNTDSIHAERHTSPVKYFEYLGSGLTVVATNSLAHKLLPLQEQIYYFDLESKDSFLTALDKALKQSVKNKPLDIESLTLENRMKKLVKFINARPEGLEPSTP